MRSTQVILLFGGESSEHDVSIASARNVYAAIDKGTFRVSLVYIDRAGKWWLIDDFDDHATLQGASQIAPLLGAGKFVTVPDGRTVDGDVVLPILHGRNGEDGTVQGLAQLLHMPIVGCDVTASGVSMNKLATKEVLSANALPVIPFIAHREYETVPEYSDVIATLGDVLFVKPARAGSSVGVSKVRNEAEFKSALEKAHQHDPIALIEQAIDGQELEVAILGTPPNHQVSGVGEIIPGEDFYSYDDKYAADSQAQVRTQADISEAVKQDLQRIAKQAYETLDCRGLARVDFVLDSTQKPYIMEVNTMPGFTNISMYPKLWESEGVSYTKLIEMLISDALQNGTIKAIT